MSDQDHKNVLIVDDDASIRLMLKRVINFLRSSYIVFTASTKTEALNLLNDHNFDLVISDYELPDGDGTYIITHPNIKGKKIGISGSNPDSQFIAKCDAYLPKPFHITEIKNYL